MITCVEIKIPLDVVVLVHTNRFLLIILFWVLNVGLNEIHLKIRKNDG